MSSYSDACAICHDFRNSRAVATDAVSDDELQSKLLVLKLWLKQWPAHLCCALLHRRKSCLFTNQQYADFTMILLPWVETMSTPSASAHTAPPT